MTSPNFVATFLQEAEELLRQVEAAALELDASLGDADLINQLFRAFHTIKGSGAMVGFNAVVSFTHHVETALDHVREGRLASSPTLVSLVLAAKDHIEMLLASATEPAAGNDAAGNALAARFEALCQSVASPASSDAAAAPVPPDASEPGHGSPSEDAEGTAFVVFADPPDAPKAVQSGDAYRIVFELPPSVLGLGVDPGCILRDLRELGPCTFHAGVENVPPPSELGPNPCLSWDLTLQTQRPLAAIRDAFIFVEDLAQIRIDRIASPEVALLATAVEATAAPSQASALVAEPAASSGALTASTAWSAIPAPRGAEPSASAPTPAAQKRGAQQSTVRVPSERLDQLVSLVGELVINQSRLTQAFVSGGGGDMAGAVEAMDRLIAELRDSVLGIRMMPIGSTFSRFQRLARDLSAELGKQVDFITEGGETELDKTVIDKLGDPLVHLIRNSLDHGIEPPDERARKGKSSAGRMRLAASHQGAHVVISIQDDGRGLNASALRAKAEAKGLISADAHLTEQQTFDLVFLPGLSTARQITNISGRGVGLDVVKRTIEELRGSITLSSAPGGGTTTRLTLPLTLAIVDGLLVEVDADRFIIPMASVLENVELSRAERHAKNGRNLVNVRGELVPYVRLRQLFEAAGPELELEKVVIVGVNGQRLGLVVDHVLGSHQTVIQPLGRFYRHVDLFSGTTIMGDGRVAIIIDLAGIVRQAECSDSERSLAAPEGRGPGPRKPRAAAALTAAPS